MMSPKSIAVPPNPSARRGAFLKNTVAQDGTGNAVSPAVASPRPNQPHPIHRYHVGERLRMGHGGNTLARIAGSCKVVALLPDEGRGPLLYRVRGDAEPFERVVAEADLSRA